jgi:hypothetical protein
MTTTEQFISMDISISDECESGIRGLITDVTDTIGRDAYFSRVEPIEFRNVSGFYPYTQGGYNGVVTFGLNGSEESQSTKRIAPIAEKDYEEMIEGYRAEHGIAADAELNYDVESWQEWEMAWRDSEASWFVYVRAIFFGEGNHRNQTGEDEVCFMGMVNDDFDYGRDHVGAWAGDIGSHDFYERTVKVADCTPELLAEVKAELLAAWAEA